MQAVRPTMAAGGCSYGRHPVNSALTTCGRRLWSSGSSGRSGVAADGRRSRSAAASASAARAAGVAAREVVSTDALVDGLWGERPPETAAKSLQVYVSRLRKVLGEEVIVTRPPVTARVAPEQFDLADSSASSTTRGTTAGEAATSLRDALALWRGQPLADLPTGSSREPRSPVSRSSGSPRSRTHRCRSGARAKCSGHRRARGPGAHSPLPRAPARAAHARAVPIWAPGGRFDVYRETRRRSRRSSDSSRDPSFGTSNGASLPTTRRSPMRRRRRGDERDRARRRRVIVLVGCSSLRPRRRRSGRATSGGEASRRRGYGELRRRHRSGDECRSRRDPARRAAERIAIHGDDVWVLHPDRGTISHLEP